jgi:hypothetical protein
MVSITSDKLYVTAFILFVLGIIIYILDSYIKKVVSDHLLKFKKRENKKRIIENMQLEHEAALREENQRDADSYIDPMADQNTMAAQFEGYNS